MEVPRVVEYFNKLMYYTFGNTPEEGIMKTPSLLLSAVLIALFTACTTKDQPEPAAGAGGPESDRATATSVSGETGEPLPLQPQATRILNQMSDYLSAANQFSFHSEGTEEEVLDSGPKLHLATSVDIVVRRPDRIWADIRDDHNHKRFWYDGSRITLLTVPANLYATASAPGHIDATIDYIMDEYGVVLPLADFLVSNPYDVLKEDVTGGLYVGLQSVNGVLCHHLVFTQAEIDWQIWVQEGSQPVPRKFVITYKNEPGSPHYTAHLNDWDFAPHAPDVLFAFEPPTGAQEIEFLEPSE